MQAGTKEGRSGGGEWMERAAEKAKEETRGEGKQGRARAPHGEAMVVREERGNDRVGHEAMRGELWKGQS